MYEIVSKDTKHIWRKLYFLISQETNPYVSRKILKNLKKANKIIDNIFGDDMETSFSTNRNFRKVFYESYDDITGEVVTGSYTYNKRGFPTEYGLTVANSGEVLFSHYFKLANKKSFKKHANQYNVMYDNDSTYLALLSEATSTGNCQNLAEYLNQLDGSAPGRKSTGASVLNGDYCFAWRES